MNIDKPTITDFTLAIHDHSSLSQGGLLLGYAPSSGSANYIQNQNAGSQTANLWISGQAKVSTVLASGQISSTVATGTSPLVLASTTLNTNLNADLLDSYHLADIKTWTASRGENLLSNGSALMRNNTNFSNYVFDGAQAYFSSGSFKKVGSGDLMNDEFMPVNPNLRYKFNFYARSANATGRYYSYIACYDVDNLFIGASNYMYITGTQTTLAQTLSNGATVVYLTSAANWKNASGASDHERSFIFWNYTNSFGYLYPIGTYSRNYFYNVWADGSVNYANNTITLRTPWTGGTIAAGTPLSNGSAGGGYTYIGLVYTLVPTTWTNYSGIVSGVQSDGQNTNGTFRPGTASVRIGFLNDYTTLGDTIWYANLTFATDLYLPLTGGAMSNTTVVTSLNADLLDGYHANSFALAANYIPYTGGTSNVNLGVHNLTVDTTSLFVDSVNHRVGVGTITPIGTLSLVSTIPDLTIAHTSYVEQGFRITTTRRSNYIDFILSRNLTGTSGSDNYITPYTRAANGGYQGIELAYPGNINFYASSAATTANAVVVPVARMTILGSNGFVGIGTTAPAVMLEVYGIGEMIRFGDGSSGNNAYTSYNGRGFIGFQGAGGLNLVSASSRPIIFGVGTSIAPSTELARFAPTTGYFGIGTDSPTAIVHIKAGTAAANTAPLKLTAGVSLASAESGAVEYDGTNLYFTPGTMRKTVSFSDHTHSNYDNYNQWTLQPENFAGSGASYTINSAYFLKLKAGSGMDLTHSIVGSTVTVTLTSSGGFPGFGTTHSTCAYGDHTHSNYDNYNQWTLRAYNGAYVSKSVISGQEITLQTGSNVEWDTADFASDGILVMNVINIPNIVLTGYTYGSTGLIAATDSLKVALSKLQTQMPKTLYYDIADYVNVGSSATDLENYTLPANTLSSDGQRLELHYSGSSAANTTSKTIQFYFGGTSYIVITNSNASSLNWFLRITIIRYSSTYFRLSFDGNWNVAGSGNVIGSGINYAATNVIKLTAQAGASNEIICKLATISHFSS